MNPARLTAFRSRARLNSEAVFAAGIRLGTSPAVLAATTAGLKHTDKLAVGGFLDQDEITFRVRKDLLTAMPDVGQHLFWIEGNRAFRVDHVSTGSQLTNFYTLGCNATTEA